MLNHARRAITMAAMAAMLMLFAFSASVATAGDGTSTFSTIPKDSMMVLSINVDRLKGSDLYKLAMQKVMAEAEAKQLIEMLKGKAGFDIEKHLQTVVISIPPDVETSQNFLIIAEGTFDEAKILSAMTDSGAKLTKEKHASGADYHVIDGEGAVSFAGNTAIFGTKKMVSNALDAKKGTKDNISLHPEMNKLTQNVNKTQDIWVAFNIPASLKAQMGANPMINDLKTVTASIDIKSGFGLAINLDTASDKTAGTLAQMMQAQVKAFAGAPEMKKMNFDVALQQLKVNANKTAVEITLNLGAAEFAKVQKAIENAIKSGF